MKKYDLSTTRKVVASEKTDYIKAAIEFARNSPAPVYEGSRQPTRSVLFTVLTPYEGMTKYAKLASEGWELDINFKYQMAKLSDRSPLQFAALAPHDYFDEHLMPIIAMSAESAYEREVAEHNKLVARGKADAQHREVIKARIIAEREAELNAEVDRQIRGNKQRPNYEALMNSGFTDA
ncbi:hypothetical protein IQK56_14470 [Pseudomonas sp. MAFF 301449]|uniref:Uncharacterized protein n=1 Tax=Pseudomonas cyclaminis TaxID=2781239 RepID=A0ABR9SUQ2_9PSED|nr:hypothetical protein [Pseudomonas cyclaminis]MBE8592039.1 hypothetical protein [Pseudomonas cyclaminis]MBE8600849.1 hypothetical protein [Pseudomonas cyclaminis]